MSIDAFIVNLLKKVGTLGLELGPEATFLAQVYEVKEALGI